MNYIPFIQVCQLKLTKQYETNSIKKVEVFKNIYNLLFQE